MYCLLCRMFSYALLIYWAILLTPSANVSNMKVVDHELISYMVKFHKFSP